MASIGRAILGPSPLTDINFKNKDIYSFEWVNQNKKSVIKIGRYVKKILTDNNYNISDKNIEIFVDYWKANFTNLDNIEYKIVEGEDIKKYYNSINYYYSFYGNIKNKRGGI